MGIRFWASGYDDNDSALWAGIEGVFGGAPNDTVVDDYSPGFEKFGNIEFWHPAAEGYLDHMWWTYSTDATSPDDDTCYATWTPVLPERGYYEVFVHIPSVNSVASARYAVNHDFGADSVTVRQADYFEEWVSLGSHSFERGEGGSVYLGDGTGFAGERIGFDAVSWTNYRPLPAPDTLVTLGSDGFRWIGPIKWRRIVPGGLEDCYYWTKSITGSDINGGWWYPNLPASGEYLVKVYIPESDAEEEVLYRIGHPAGEDSVILDNSTYSGE